MKEAHRGELLAGYFTPAQAAKAIEVSRRTLDALFARRLGPPRTKIAQRVYYRIEALEQWLREQEHRPARSGSSGPDAVREEPKARGSRRQDQ